MCCCFIWVHFTLHEDNDDIQKLLEGQIAVAVFVGQREHGVHKQGVGLEAQGLRELGGRQLTLKYLPGLLAGHAAHVARVTLLYLQHLDKRKGRARDYVTCDHGGVISDIADVSRGFPRNPGEVN